MTFYFIALFNLIELAKKATLDLEIVKSEEGRFIKLPVCLDLPLLFP